MSKKKTATGKRVKLEKFNDLLVDDKRKFYATLLFVILLSVAYALVIPSIATQNKSTQNEKLININN